MQIFLPGQNLTSSSGSAILLPAAQPIMPLNVSLMSGVPGSAIIASQHGRVAIPPTPKSQTVTARPRIQPAYSGELEILLD